MKNEMVTRKTWEEFRKTKLLFAINQFLHFFGYSIVIEQDDETGKITDVYPARVKYRGFGEKSIDEGYRGVAKYMVENAEELLKEAEE